MKHLFFVCMGLLLALSYVGCSSDDDSPAQDYTLQNNSQDSTSQNNSQDSTLLYNTWLLVSYGNESNEVLKEANGYYYIMTFNPDGTFSGDIYGNEMGGEYKCSGHRITISRPWMTKVYWEGSDPDEFFLNHIDDVYSYVVTNTELRLYYSDNEYFKFRVKK